MPSMIVNGVAMTMLRCRRRCIYAGRESSRRTSDRSVSEGADCLSSPGPMVRLLDGGTIRRRSRPRSACRPGNDATLCEGGHDPAAWPDQAVHPRALLNSDRVAHLSWE